MLFKGWDTWTLQANAADYALLEASIALSILSAAVTAFIHQEQVGSCFTGLQFGGRGVGGAISARTCSFFVALFVTFFVVVLIPVVNMT